jgi:A/G-specific adenine glycosylase
VSDALDLLSTWVRVLSLRTRLLRWYDENRRDLPWRRSRDPYGVLVSEFMLQQTRVETVLPYYDRWMARWPAVTDLAAATEDEVVAAWSGLGYYRRARFLHRLARVVVTEHGGELPSDPAALRELPGVGPYTAAAVASIAFDAAVPVVDGNVERVLARLLCDTRKPGGARKGTAQEAARRLVTAMTDDDADAQAPPDGLRASDWNQALMELGAVVCTPGEPNCPACPWRRSCLGHRAGLAAELPKRRRKSKPTRVTQWMALVRRGEHFLLVRRPEGTLLSGMWELPTANEDESLATLAPLVTALLGTPVELSKSPIRTFHHAITTRRLTVHVHEARVEPDAVADAETPGIAWVRRVDLRDFGVSSMTRKALA